MSRTALITFRVRGYRMSWAGIVVAAIFAVAHIDKRSRSIVAPSIGHDVGDVVEYSLCLVLIYCWT